jgi:hypothetical protein
MATQEPITSDETTGQRRVHGRPLGVLVLAILLVLHAIAVAWSLPLPPMALPLAPFQPFPGLAPINPAAALVVLPALLLAAGLWWQGRWAWLLTTLWVGASLAVALAAYFDRQPPYLVMLLSVLAVFYLNQPEVRASFSVTRAPAEAPA